MRNTMLLAALLAAPALAAPPKGKPCAYPLPVYLLYRPEVTLPGQGPGAPVPGCWVALGRETMAIQKIRLGYIVMATPGYYPNYASDTALLMTPQELQQDEHPGGYAVYQGTGTYETVLGFTKTAHVFVDIRNLKERP